MSERGRGHPVVGALAGLVFGGSLGVLLLTIGVLPLESIVLVILPIVGLVVGIAWGLLAPLGRRA